MRVSLCATVSNIVSYAAAAVGSNYYLNRIKAEWLSKDPYSERAKARGGALSWGWNEILNGRVPTFSKVDTVAEAEFKRRMGASPQEMEHSMMAVMALTALSDAYIDSLGRRNQWYSSNIHFIKVLGATAVAATTAVVVAPVALLPEIVVTTMGVYAVRRILNNVIQTVVPCDSPARPKSDEKSQREQRDKLLAAAVKRNTAQPLRKS